MMILLMAKLVIQQAILTEILRDELLTVVHDEDPSHIQLNVVLLLLVLKEIKGGSSRHKKQGSEFQLTLY